MIIYYIMIIYIYNDNIYIYIMGIMKYGSTGITHDKS